MSNSKYTIDSLCEKLKTEINTIISPEAGRKSSGISEKQRAKLKSAVRQACYSGQGDREYLKECIKDIIEKRLRLGPSEIAEVIRFESSRDMSPQDKFEYMYSMYAREYGSGAFRVLMRDAGWDRPGRGDEEDFDRGGVRAIIDSDVEFAYLSCPLAGNYNDRLNTVVQRCYQRMYGHDVADIFIADTSVDSVSGGTGGKTRDDYNFMEELLAGGSGYTPDSMCWDTLFVVAGGRLLRMKFLSFGNRSGIERVVKNLCRFNTRTVLSRKDPVLLGTLKDNSRVVAARPPVSDGWAFYVRKFTSSSAKELSKLIVHKNAEQVIALLEMLPAAELNFVVSGNTGGGKTTLVKALVKYIDPQYCIRVVESSFELGLNNLYPERNIHVLQERGDFTVYDAVTATKKMDTDVLLIGEVNEPKLAGAFIQVAQSGSRMAITTLHHESTEKLVEYLRNALASECGISDMRVAEQQVIDVIRFDVHMVHDTKGNHYIERITEIVPVAYGDYPKDPETACIEFFRRMTDRKLCEYRNIVEFNRKTMSYEITGHISRAARKQIEDKLGGRALQRLGGLV